MEKQLFRKSSIDKVSSPEQLNDYVRVSNPGVWMILAAVIVLLVGVCVWGVFGRLDTVIDAAASCENGTLTLYIREPGIEQVGIELPDAAVRIIGIVELYLSPLKLLIRFANR